MGCKQQIILSGYGAPGKIRTPDPLVRSQVLCPTELQAQKEVYRLIHRAISIKTFINLNCYCLSQNL